MKRKGFTLIELLVVIAIIAILAAILFPVFAKAQEKAKESSCQSNLKQLALGVSQYASDYDGKFPAQFVSWTGKSNNGTAIEQWPFWLCLIYPYVKNAGVYTCPSDNATTSTFDPALVPHLQQDQPTKWQEISYDINFYVSGPEGWSDFGEDDGAYSSFGIHYATLKQSQLESAADTFLMWCGSSLDSATDWDIKNLHMCRTMNDPSAKAYSWNGPLGGNVQMKTQRHNEGTNYAFCDGHVKWLKADSVPDWDERFFPRKSFYESHNGAATLKAMAGE